MALALPLWYRHKGSLLDLDPPAFNGPPFTSSSGLSIIWSGRSPPYSLSNEGEHQGLHLKFTRQIQSKKFIVAVSRKQNQFTTVCAAAPDRNAGTEKSNSNLTITNAQITAAPAEEDNKLRIRVDINGQTSQRAFDVVLRDLARNAPPVPGFRKAKGGKTSMVPLNVAYQFIGPKAVRKFVIDEIIKSTLGDYLEKENIKVKDELKTDQSSDELLELFEPGKGFGFDATLDLEIPGEAKEDEAIAQDAVSPPLTVEASM